MSKFYTLSLLAVFMLMISVTSLKSCPGANFGGRFNTIFPLGEESKFTSTSFGFDLYGGYRFPKCSWDMGLNLRYTSWPVKNSRPGLNYSNNSWDLWLYDDYEYDEDDCDFEPYAGPQIGIHNWMSSSSYTYSGRTTTFKDSGTDFAWGLHAGTYYNINKNIKLDLRLEYSNYLTKPNSQSNFGISLGARYVFTN